MNDAANGDTMTDIELMPCPFCGGKVELTSRDGETSWDEIGIIFCPGCNSKYENTMDFRNPAETWNRRAQLTASALASSPLVKAMIQCAVDNALESNQVDDSTAPKSGSNVRKFYPKNAAKISDNVLEQAMGQYGSLLILGYDHEGQMDVRASLDLSDGGDILWLLEVFKSKLLNGDYSAGA